MTGSSLSVANSLGIGTVPISTPAPDANGNIAPLHLAGYVAAGVATPVSATTPLPVAGALTQASGPWSVSWSGQSVAATQSGTWTVALVSGSTVALGAGSAAIGSVSVSALPALSTGANVIGGVVQSGTWTVSLTGGNATAVKTDGSATIQPVSATALPLPAGAATDAQLVAINTKLAALLAAELPYQGAIPMIVGTAQTAQRAVRVACTTAGNVSLTYTDGSTDVVPVAVGLSYLAGAITMVNASGTTATATYANMK